MRTKSIAGNRAFLRPPDALISSNNVNDKNESDIDKTKRFDIQEAYESESSVSGFTTERDYVPN